MLNGPEIKYEVSAMFTNAYIFSYPQRCPWLFYNSIGT